MEDPLTLDWITKALARHLPGTTPFVAEKNRAAVAMILSGEPQAPSLCFIRRAERKDDPWSGHMAFPGGRAEAQDKGPRDVAERETLEEIGLRINGDHFIGPLAEMPVRLGGVDTGMRLSSFVYYLPRPQPFAPNHEVAQAYWVPLKHLWDADNCTQLQLERNGTRMVFPAVQFEDTAIWGLTYRVLTLFSDVLDCPLPHLEKFPD